MADSRSAWPVFVPTAHLPAPYAAAIGERLVLAGDGWSRKALYDETIQTEEWLSMTLARGGIGTFAPLSLSIASGQLGV